MGVRPGWVSGWSHPPYHIPFTDTLSVDDADHTQVAVEGLKAIAVVNHNHVSVSTRVPACMNYDSGIRRNVKWFGIIGDIDSRMVPGEVLSDNSLCRPDKLTWSSNCSCVGGHLSYSGGSGYGRHNSIRNNYSLPYGQFKRFIIGKSIEGKINYGLGLSIVFTCDWINRISLNYCVGNTCDRKNFQRIADFDLISRQIVGPADGILGNSKFIGNWGYCIPIDYCVVCHVSDFLWYLSVNYRGVGWSGENWGSRWNTPRVNWFPRKLLSNKGSHHDSQCCNCSHAGMTKSSWKLAAFLIKSGYDHSFSLFKIKKTQVKTFDNKTG